MERILTPTEDGSMTLYIPELNEHYHSIHGAIQESRHIFIRAGLEYFLETHPDSISLQNPLHILEAGFGTGLNAWLTLIRTRELQLPVCYHSIEKYPLASDEIASLNYSNFTAPAEQELFNELHRCPWETEQSVSPYSNYTNTGKISGTFISGHNSISYISTHSIRTYNLIFGQMRYSIASTKP